jgi:hypothetical protein
MKEEFRIIRESAKTKIFPLDPEQVAGEIVIKFIKKPPSNTSITLLCSLFCFALQNKSMAEENTIAIENSISTPEVIIKHWSATFPYALISAGPIGCKIESSEKVCRKDEKPVSSYSYKVISSKGWGSSIIDINQDGPCIIVYYKLSVDHSGPEGRTCLTPNADLQIRLELSNKSHSSTTQP